jgi:hypothetical protein
MFKKNQERMRKVRINVDIVIVPFCQVGIYYEKAQFISRYFSSFISFWSYIFDFQKSSSF